MRIAIIGSGISGLTSAYYLQKQGHDVFVFEASDYIGGHTNTVNVSRAGQNYAIDTGFIVFNHQTYPNFTHLLNELHVDIKNTEMSFSVYDIQGVLLTGCLPTVEIYLILSFTVC